MVKENYLSKILILHLKEPFRMGSCMGIIVCIKRKIIFIMGHLLMGKNKGLEYWSKKLINM